MNQSRTIGSPVIAIAFCCALGAVPKPGWAQEPGAKVRLELADTARRSTRPRDATGASAPKAMAAPASARVGVRPARAPARAPAHAPGAAAIAPSAPPIAPGFRADFVRNQTLLGVAIYGPAFASTVATDGVAWGATYLLVAGGSFVAAAEVSREMSITDPMQRLATWMPVQGAIAGGLLSSLVDADRRGRAAAVLFSSLGATATALWRGREMTDGEAAATLFGTNVLGLTAAGAATAAGLTTHYDGTTNKARLGIALGGMILGAPLGHAYAALAPYNVTPGDLTAMSAMAGVGMLGGLAFIADKNAPSDREVAGVLTAGAIVGLVAGDRLLVRRYDHTPGEGRLVMVGGVAGGLMGAGVALLTGGKNAQWGTAAAALTTLGAAGGIALAQRYAAPKADGGLRVGALSLNPAGFVAAASGMGGSYTLGSIRF